MKKVLYRSFIVSAILSLCIVLAACPQGTEKAATGVHDYLTALKAFQDAEVQLHKDGKVPNDTHFVIQERFKAATAAARQMDACIAATSQGLPADTCIDSMNNSFQLVLGATNTNPDLKQALALVSEAADAALKNAILFIREIKPQTPSKPAPAALLWMFLPLAVVGGAGALSTATLIAEILKIAMQMEPIAQEALLNFLKAKGKDTTAILALNKELEDQIDATADAELANKPK